MRNQVETRVTQVWNRHFAEKNSSQDGSKTSKHHEAESSSGSLGFKS